MDVSLLAAYQYRNNPKFCDDDIINRVNNFVSLHKQEQRLKTSHVEKILKRMQHIVSKRVKLVIKEGLIPLMKEHDSLFAKRFNSIMYGGSYYKRTKIEKPNEYDLNIIVSLPWKEDTLKFETPEKKPGFIQIQLTQNSKLPEWETYATQLNKMISSNNYIDQNKFREWMESVVVKSLNSLPEDPSRKNGRILKVKNMEYSVLFIKSGPSFTFMIKDLDGQIIDVDFVTCLEFSVPPPKRYKGFTDEPKNWLIIPKPLTEENGNLMWRTSFYRDEKEHLKGPMKTIIRLLKKLRNTEKMKNFASYFIETLALHEIRSYENDPTFMKLPITCIFMHMLERLRDAARKHEIPFFWCKDMNILYKISAIEMKNYAARFTHIISIIKQHIATDEFIIASFILKPDELIKLKATKSHSSPSTQEMKELQGLKNTEQNENTNGEKSSCPSPKVYPGSTITILISQGKNEPPWNIMKLIDILNGSVIIETENRIKAFSELQQELNQLRKSIQFLPEKVDKLETRCDIIRQCRNISVKTEELIDLKEKNSHSSSPTQEVKAQTLKNTEQNENIDGEESPNVRPSSTCPSPNVDPCPDFEVYFSYGTDAKYSNITYFFNAFYGGLVYERVKRNENFSELREELNQLRKSIQILSEKVEKMDETTCVIKRQCNISVKTEELIELEETKSHSSSSTQEMKHQTLKNTEQNKNIGGKESTSLSPNDNHMTIMQFYSVLNYCVVTETERRNGMSSKLHQELYQLRKSIQMLFKEVDKLDKSYTISEMQSSSLK